MTTAALLSAALLLSFIFLPWSVTMLLALLAGLADPLLLIASGLLADALYYAHEPALPFFTLLAFAAAPCLYLVRRSVKTSIIT